MRFGKLFVSFVIAGAVAVGGVVLCNSGHNTVKAGIVDPAEPFVITSGIDGKFDGYSKGKVFTLKNGQKWKQLSPETVTAQLDSPEVIIYKTKYGPFMMAVSGMETNIEVGRASN